uniref:Tail completion protein n=1 Tax=Dulem virus 34 TaxID=3145752 RepID=A0AAU8B536_9CAUD
MTQELLLDTVVEDLEKLFSHYKLVNSLGVERTVRVFPQDLPIREGDDEETDKEAPPEPYVIVRLPEGELPEQDARQTVEVVLVVCVCDPDRNRQGYRDAFHIVNEIMQHYGANGVVGNRYEVQYPIKWATQEKETHPYYFAAVGLSMAAPAIFKEVPET